MGGGTTAARWRGAGPALIGGGIVAALAGMAFLFVDVAADLRLLQTASSDNVQWTLSQAEVEFLDLQTELARAAQAPEPDLAALRRRFDVFYSRVATLSTGQLYRGISDDPDARLALGPIREALDAAVPLVDAPDAELAPRLPELAQAMAPVRADLRDLATAGLRHFAAESDTHRERISRTLMTLALVTSALVAVLLLLALHLNGVSRQNIRRRAQVQAASARLEAVINTALDAVVVTDRTGVILEFNAAAEAMFGHPREDAVGRTIGALLVPEHLRAGHDAGMRRMAEGGERRVVGRGRVRVEGLRAGGEVFPVELSIQSAEQGGQEVFVAFLRDISSRVKAERELIDARDRALAGEKAKATFLAVMSHEIRTPLNGLLGNLALLKDTGLDAAQADLARRMDVSGRQLMKHVNDVLDIARHDAGKAEVLREPVDLDALLRDIVDAQRTQARAHGTALGWAWAGAPQRWVLSDRGRIEQILLNLVGNAIKFTVGGRVRLEAEVVARAGRAVTLELRVEDTGIGIAEADLPRIFEDFVTLDASFGRRADGTGLGLGIARRIAAALGGSIGARSRPGEGSCFWVRLPAEATAAPAAEPAADAAPAIPPRRVLVVEDNEINRHVVREMLRRDGHAVIEAENGRDAVALAATDAFDLILMDVSMPVMDGLAATRAIRSRGGAGAATPIVAFTANVLPGDAETFAAAGMDGSLGKPLTAEALRATLARFAAGRPRPEGAGAAEGAAAAADAAATIDALRAEETRELIGEAAFARFLARFESEMAAFWAWRDANPGADPAEIAAQCHRLASSAGTFGAAPLREALLAVEGAARDPSGALDPALRAARAAWEAAHPSIRTLVTA